MTTQSRLLVLACIAALVGCQARPGASPAGPVPPAAPPAAPDAGAIAGAALAETILVDVDPIHGFASERATRALQATSVARKLKLLAEFPQVSHDVATGRTTVTLQLTNAGDDLNYLACRVGGERKVISPAYQWNTTVSKTAQTQTQALVFENPSGGAFTVELSFTGIMAVQAPLDTGAATSAPSTTPSAAPTATPTPAATPTPSAAPSAAPTATPTPAPTATPTPSPTPTAAPSAGPGGAWSATASSSYGGLPPRSVADGDLATMWANDGYQAPSAWVAVDTGASRAMGVLNVKMKPQSGGATYAIQTSDDAVGWTTVASGLKNTSWNLEAKPLPAGTSARHVRLLFTNDPTAPEQRFSVYEIRLDGAGSAVQPTPAPTPTPGPTSPPATSSLVRTFDADALGSDPAEWIDPNDDGYAYEWMPRLAWKIVEHDGSRQYMHDNLSNYANLSFRRYKGAGLGTENGLLPNKYFAELDVTPIRSYTYAPTGDQGTQFYYLSPTHYMELLIKPGQFEVWSAINAVPFQGNGWTRLWYTDVKTEAGQKRRLGSEVDATTGEFKVYFDGQLMATLKSSVITTQAHWFALRGTGNVVTHDNIRIEPR